jgi:hypothetical protein
MRPHNWALIAVLSLSLPAGAYAQGGNAGSGQAGTAGTPGTATSDPRNPATADEPVTAATGGRVTASPSDPAPTATQTSNASDNYGSAPSSWFASGFVGSNFGASSDGAGMDFGGSVGYLWHSIAGAEFVAGFTPNFQLQNNILLSDEPQVNTYMFNAIGAIPLGVNANWQPFVSGGLGALTLGSATVNTGDNTGAGTAANTFEPDDSRFGGNIGFGVMGFAGNWGLRGDVRYFKAFSDNAPDSAVQAILPGLDFWRANIGVAVRW